MRNLFAAFTLMAIAGAASAQNVFYNQTPNVFGGYNTPLPSGGFATSQPNIFGGTTTTMPSGRSITGMPNLFGGQNFNDGTSTQRNVFGGTTYSRPGAPRLRNISATHCRFNRPRHAWRLPYCVSLDRAHHRGAAVVVHQHFRR
ncbi:MAG: hypothetical protein NTZ71_04560 [Planctomycetota bacterium]|nr:hypothetical protein [Planctomycetota bacterium]